jgi:hypothetical protein
MNLKNCPDDNRGGGFVPAFVRKLVSFNTRWGGSCKFLKFDLHAGYQYFFFPIFWTNVVSMFWNGQHTRISIFYFFYELITIGYALGLVLPITYLEPPNPVMHMG